MSIEQLKKLSPNLAALTVHKINASSGNVATTSINMVVGLQSIELVQPYVPENSKDFKPGVAVKFSFDRDALYYVSAELKDLWQSITTEPFEVVHVAQMPLPIQAPVEQDHAVERVVFPTAQEVSVPKAAKKGWKK